MEVDNAAIARMADILFSGRQFTTEFGSKVLGILTAPNASTGKLIELCQAKGPGAGTYEEISRAFLAAAVVHPLQTHWCLGELHRCFKADSPKDINGHFVVGSILSAFETAVWIDTHWSHETIYDKAVEDVIPDMVWCRNGMLEQGEWLATDHYRNVLTTAIKQYVAGPKYGKDIRLAQVGNALQKIGETYERKRQEVQDDKVEFPKIASMILDGLTYGFFGQMSPIGRVQAIGARHGDFLKSLLKEKAG